MQLQKGQPHNLIANTLSQIRQKYYIFCELSAKLKFIITFFTYHLNTVTGESV